MNTWSPLIDLQFHASRTDHELTRVLKVLDGIQDKMDIENDKDSELADLERETRPEDVLAEINRLQQRALARASRNIA